MTAHKHAASMLLYAQDAAETDKPWERWEFCTRDKWNALSFHPLWEPCNAYRRKPKTIKVNGFDVPAPLIAVEGGTKVWYPVLTSGGYVDCEYYTPKTPWLARCLERGLLHATQEAAVAHAKAMLGIAPLKGEQ